MTASQLRYVETTNESEKAALAASKEHEKHWREGYESLYTKYSKVKKDLGDSES